MCNNTDSQYIDELTMNPANESTRFSTNCLICGEPVLIYDPRDVPKVCEICRLSIMRLREESR